jgi:hypothetical protein
VLVVEGTHLKLAQGVVDVMLDVVLEEELKQLAGVCQSVHT